MKNLVAKYKTGRLNDVVVAVLGMGINALHPEFFTKRRPVHSGKEESPFGQNIISKKLYTITWPLYLLPTILLDTYTPDVAALHHIWHCT